MMPSVTARGNGRVHKPRTFLRSVLSLSRWHTHVHTNSLARAPFLSVSSRPPFSLSSSLFPLTKSFTVLSVEASPIWIPLGRQGRRLIGVCCWISWLTGPCWDNLIQNTTIMRQSTGINTIAQNPSSSAHQWLAIPSEVFLKIAGDRPPNGAIKTFELTCAEEKLLIRDFNPCRLTKTAVWESSPRVLLSNSGMDV